LHSGNWHLILMDNSFGDIFIMIKEAIESPMNL
jgi:hypothetical protein